MIKSGNVHALQGKGSLCVHVKREDNLVIHQYHFQRFKVIVKIVEQSRR